MIHQIFYLSSWKRTVDISYQNLLTMAVFRLLLAAVSGEGAQERSERTILSPWLRFLWESYRQCLELLRNNMQVETLYHKVAKQAFAFCLKFQRKTEFRKLCDNVRDHFYQLKVSEMLIDVHFIASNSLDSNSKSSTQ